MLPFVAWQGTRGYNLAFLALSISAFQPRRTLPDSMPRILVTPYLLQHAPGPYREILEKAGFEVVYPTVKLSESVPDPEGLLAQLQGIEGVLAGSELYTSDVLAKTSVRAIARMGVGYDAIDVKAATANDIVVTIAPGTNENSVAELTIALMLGVFRGFPARDKEARSGAWKRRVLPRLAGKTLGLVGLGRIGKAVVPRAIGLGLKLIAFEPFPDVDFCRQHGIRLCDLEELFRIADVVSLHCPCTSDNANMINARSLAMMKSTAVLINTARGGLVDETALARSLTEGKLFGAGLDAFKIEPLPADSPLAQLDNVLLCPHMGGLDDDSARDMACLAAQCLADLFMGKWPEPCVVNREIPPNWKWKAPRRVR